MNKLFFAVLIVVATLVAHKMYKENYQEIKPQTVEEHLSIDEVLASTEIPSDQEDSAPVELEQINTALPVSE